jgi:polysaccharide biosynthesis protein PslJ
MTEYNLSRPATAAPPFLASARWRSLWVGMLVGVVAALAGLLAAQAGPVIALGAVLGAGAGLYVLTNLSAGLYAVLAVVALLPFATLPFSFALTPTFLDLALGGFLLVYLFQWMTGKRRRLQWTWPSIFFLAFAAIMIVSFVAGLGHAPLTQSVLRKFVEMLLSISLVFVLTDVLRDVPALRRAASILILFGMVQALLGIGLYLLNDTTSERALNSLGRFGYPRGGVIRYVEDNPALGERAIGTWVDPNAYGGFLSMVGALAFVQVLATRPVQGKRWLAVLCFAVIAAAAFLTQSRGAWLALAGAIFFVAVVRYRWLLLAGFISLVILLSLPFMQNYVERLTSGLAGEDLATQMRIGEYRDAFTLIGRYPLLGVGFAGAPERDIYLGVSSTYLKIAGATGLSGLLIFLAGVAGVFAYGFGRWKQLKAKLDLQPVWLGAMAGLVSALVSGVVDHYYFNLEFQGAVLMLWLFVGLALASAQAANKNALTVGEGI